MAQFLIFCWTAFTFGKIFTVTEIRPWTDYAAKKPLGWIVDVAITADKTAYKFEDGEASSNIYEKLSFKCVMQPMVNVSDEMLPVNPVYSIWGDFHNNFSVKCDVAVLASTVAAAAEKEKN